MKTKTIRRRTEAMRLRETGEVPEPVKRSSRIGFRIAYFKTEEDADKYERYVQALGRTYNGGYFHGSPCGREKHRDYVDPEHGQLYAVTE